MFKNILISTRFGNLLIVAFGQYLMLNLLGYSNYPGMFLLILSTCSIAFGGYVINDLFDQQIDDVNRPGRNLFRQGLFKKYGISIYFLVNLVGIGAMTFFNSKMVLFNVACVALLYAYSSLLKKRAVAGNLLVAIMQSAVFLIIYLAVDHELNRPALLTGFELNREFLDFLNLMILFSLVTGWIREWVKDIEDKDGDEQNGLKTAAIIWPLKTNKALIALLCALLIAGVGVFTLFLHLNYWSGFKDVLNYYYLFLMFPISIRALLMLIKADSKEDWSKLSQWLKIIMLAGILSIGIAT